uniref:Uncharacterized protein n=1 Tax=Moniliophthora roreri TaxID=221103 RepID=A0A0W0FTR3_MONRR
MVQSPAELTQVSSNSSQNDSRELTPSFSHGPLFIGAILTILLFGISVTQTCVYWSTYNKDHWFLRYFVLLLFIADAVHCVFITIYLYDSVIIHFGDVAFLAAPNWVEQSM